MTEMITESSDGSLIWYHRKSPVKFETDSGAIGLSYRLAFDKKGKRLDIEVAKAG